MQPQASSKFVRALPKTPLSVIWVSRSFPRSGWKPYCVVSRDSRRSKRHEWRWRKRVWTLRWHCTTYWQIILRYRVLRWFGHPLDRLSQYFKAYVGIPIHTMHVCECTLSTEDARELNSLLQTNNTTMQDLHLERVSFSPLDLRDIVSGLYHNRTLRSLDIESDSINDFESAELLRSLLERNRSLQKLSLYNDSPGGRETFQGVVQGLTSRSNQVKHLKLENFSVEDDDFATLVTVLHETSPLATIELHGIDLTVVGMGHLVRLRERLPVLDVSLAHNQVGAVELSPLAAYLHSPQCRLNSLSIGLNDIGDEAVRLIFTALEGNQSLDHLSFNGVEFSSEGVTTLSQSVPNIKCLKELKFSWPWEED